MLNSGFFVGVICFQILFADEKIVRIFISFTEFNINFEMFFSDRKYNVVFRRLKDRSKNKPMKIIA